VNNNPGRVPRYWFPKPYADFVQRLRVASGFLLLVAFAWFPRPSVISITAGLPIAVAGLFIRGWAAGHLAKNRALATGGPYAYMRNPLYAGTLLVAAGMALACRSAILAAILVCVFILIYLPVIELEEQHLRTLFPSYAAYAARVHRLLPVSRWENAEGTFSWKLYAKNQEFKAAAGFLIAVAWLVWKCQ
jgi:protein-S-isoprenylcysteine O-methyltransferase Ste14